jgi:uncharacterized protein with ParB-like and HNH nuclease domain
MSNEFVAELLVEENAELLVEEDAEASDGQIDEYDLSATPNDFNVMTINSFIDSGSIQIPGFQRNYVWDIKKASKLIESLLLGLPVPQLFLYESDRNKFLVIDGQQRMMSIFYFIKNRFPRKEKRGEIRQIFAENDGLPDEILQNDEYFQNFKLNLSKPTDEYKNKFHGLNYSTLGDYKTQLDLRPIRNIVVKQNSPHDSDSSIYEIFNRLNSGGVNLRPQEIRGCLYHSEFYAMLGRINCNPDWRTILKMPNLDLHMKDIELLLRSFAMAIEYRNYKPSLANFLNAFSKKAKSINQVDIAYYESLFNSFIDSLKNVNPDVFISEKSRRFNIFIFESVFSCLSQSKLQNRTLFVDEISEELVRKVLADNLYQEASIGGTTNITNVNVRFDVTETIFL